MPHTRKRARAPVESDNRSIITAQSSSSEEFSSQTISHDEFTEICTKYIRSYRELSENFQNFMMHPNLSEITMPEAVPAIATSLLLQFRSLHLRFPAIVHYPDFVKTRHLFGGTLQSIQPDVAKMDASVSTKPTPESPKPTYASIAAQADAPTLSLLAQPPPQGPSLSHSLSPTHTITMGSGPTGHSPKPSVPKPRKSARFAGASPKTSTAYIPHPPKPKSGQQVRLVACIANRPDSSTSDNPRWKAVPTDCFSTLAKELQSAAPGCVPLSFCLNRKGNLVITFTPTTPRSLLMSNLWIIRGSFELSHNVPILFDTTWSTLHLANVPTRLHESAPVFDQAEIMASLRNNPALAALPITLQPRWLRHPSKITGPRSSVVFSFEDPNGAIVRQLLKTPTFMFGQPVTVKSWIDKSAFIARPSRSVSNPESRALAVSEVCSHMDVTVRPPVVEFPPEVE